MPLASTLSAILLATLQTAPGQTTRAIEARVDTRVELLTIVARLAGFREFDMENSASPYATAVEARFGPLREHAAVQTLRKLRAERGVSYDAIPSFAVHLDDAAKLGERVPFEQKPERLDARWAFESARPFLVQLRDFAAQAKAAEFFAAQQPFYDQVGQRLSERLSSSKALPWFDSFFGRKAGAKYSAVAGLLCGGGNFGVGIRFADGRPEEITPVFGCWKFDEAGLPVFDESYLPLFVHEICHSYTNPLVDRFEEALRTPGAALHATCAEEMKRQSYGTWKTMLYESLVRATVVRCRLATEGTQAARDQAQEEVGRRFDWVPDLAKLMGDYEGARTQYASFEAFMPKIVTFFEERARLAAELEAKRPKLLSIAPANGATDVDPAVTQLVLTFDRPMKDKSWSFVASKDDMPEVVGSPAYDAEKRVLTATVRLVPGKTYRFALNSDRHQAFVSADGVPLQSLPVTFSTRK